MISLVIIDRMPPWALSKSFTVVFEASELSNLRATSSLVQRKSAAWVKTKSVLLPYVAVSVSSSLDESPASMPGTEKFS